MKNPRLEFTLLNDSYTILKLKELAELPLGMFTSGFFSVTGTDDEISVISKDSETDSGSEDKSPGWRILKIKGPLDFSLTGIIADFTAVLKKEEIPVFVISTYDTDYVLIQQEFIARALLALCDAGYILIS